MYNVNYALMENEQFGTCWNLEFDKQAIIVSVLNLFF